ncbi:valacyclovir hydrolase isoform X2 [Agrilus planipennis]|uniref:Valacyclovir hydrolase isoform X2 n=1 Tax=Agrilus planipennis TaxID=224129 RepID=A0A7F5RFN8_AGRPL|nr:valacyclovir hydrolase isoform X2 [Agrilus planipennis]
MLQYLKIQESKIEIDGHSINYIKEGIGDHHVLCFPGALGTIWSDFKPQVENLDKDKFCVIAFDPPGYGFSRPPDKSFGTDFYEKDAEIAYKLMKKLGIKKFSLLGWSDGGISSIILSANYPDSVKKLVIWGANSYILPEEINTYEKLRDISKWSDKMKAPLIKLYGEDGLKTLWNNWCDTLIEIAKKGGNICKNKLDYIQCPTFILHGSKDPMIAGEHPEFLLKNIKNAKIKIFPEGKHNIHLRYADEFNKAVTQFLLE